MDWKGNWSKRNLKHAMCSMCNNKKKNKVVEYGSCQSPLYKQKHKHTTIVQTKNICLIER